MEVYYKNISAKELAITQIASGFKIAPPLLKTSLDLSNNRGSFEMVKFRPLIDLQLSDQQKYINQILDKLNKLHDIGILWLDPSEENIVVDINSNNAYLIDFGASRFISELHIANSINDSNIFDIPGRYPVSIEEAKRISINEVLFFLGIGKKPMELAVYNDLLVTEE